MLKRLGGILIRYYKEAKLSFFFFSRCRVYDANMIMNNEYPNSLACNKILM